MTDPRDRAPDDLDADIDDAVEHEGDDLEPETDIDDLADDGVDELDEGEVVDADEAEIDDYDAAVREIAGEAVPAAGAIGAERPSSAARRRAPVKQPTRAPSPSEIAVHVRENVSRTFVIVAVAVYLVILLNAIFLGTGGILRPLPTPTPSPSESPSASPSASVSASPAASASESVSASPATSTTQSPSAS